MKKIFLIFAAAFVFQAATAGEGEKTEANKEPVSTPATKTQADPADNPFVPEWFIGVGGGIGVYYGDHNKQMKFGDRIAPNFDLYAGRWLNNSFGVRVGASGITAKGLTQNGAHSTGERYDQEIPWEGYWLEKQKFDYLYIHADLLFHWTNDIYLTDVGRFWDIMPYAGVGVMTTLGGDPKATRFSPNVGLLQSFTLSPAVALTLDLRGNIVGDGFDGEKGGNKLEGVGAAYLGLKYTFKK